MLNEQTPNWQTVLKRRGSLLFEVLVAKGQSQEYYSEMFGFDFELRNRKYLAGNIILDLNETRKLRSLLEEKVRENLEYLTWLSNKHYDQCEEIMSVSEKISELRNVALLGNPELEYWFRQYVDNVLRLMPSLMAMPTIERFLEERISGTVKQQLSKIGKEELLESYMTSLIIPRKENFAVKELKELFSIGAEIQADPFLMKVFTKRPEELTESIRNRPSLLSRIQGHAETFGFLNMYTYEGNPFTLEDVVVRIKEVLGQDCARKVEEIKRERLQSEERFRAIVLELKLPENIVKLIELAQEYLYLRLYRLDVLNIAGYHVKRLLEEVASRMKLTYEEIIYLSHEEILSFFAEGVISSKQMIFERKRDYGSVLLNGELRIVSGDLLKHEIAIEKEIGKGIPKDIHVLEGTVASKGKHIGKVKLVLYNPDVEKVEKGDIIVSTMTNPYYVPAMLRAGAIVTDEGGILCHAAIVSRELGVPCVVGTQIATKVLKDNDLIEVDATGLKGIVRKKQIR